MRKLNSNDGGNHMQKRLIKLETQVVHISNQIAEVRLDSKDLRKEVREDIGVLREEMQDFRKEVREDIGALRSDHKKLLGVFLNTTVFLLGTFGVGYNLLDQKIDATDSHIQTLALQMQAFSDKTAESFMLIQQQLQKMSSHENNLAQVKR